MIPNIFVSSTIQDLQHLRDAVRETIIELGYNPIMSDYGDIGYLPSTTAEESCYVTMRDCQLAILIIGKRYGSKSKTGFSITHNEFRTARENKIPIISIVDREVLSFKRVYDANIDKNTEQNFPGMDSPRDAFLFIKEIIESPLNNGILEFATTTEARQHLKKQIAHLFGDLLSHRFDPIKVQLKDVLSEIKTLRHELLKNRGSEPMRYLKATRFLLDDHPGRRRYRELAEQLSGGLDLAIPLMLESSTFKEFIQKSKLNLELHKIPPDLKNIKKQYDTGVLKAYVLQDIESKDKPPSERSWSFWGLTKDKKIIMDKAAERYYSSLHNEFRRFIDN
jgi:hypothetical protein